MCWRTWTREDDVPRRPVPDEAMRNHDPFLPSLHGLACSGTMIPQRRYPCSEDWRHAGLLHLRPCNVNEMIARAEGDGAAAIWLHMVEGGNLKVDSCNVLRGILRMSPNALSVAVLRPRPAPGREPRPCQRLGQSHSPLLFHVVRRREWVCHRHGRLRAGCRLALVGHLTSWVWALGRQVS
jgi:hypothetical protein